MSVSQIKRIFSSDSAFLSVLKYNEFAEGIIDHCRHHKDSRGKDELLESLGGSYEGLKGQEERRVIVDILESEQVDEELVVILNAEISYAEVQDDHGYAAERKGNEFHKEVLKTFPDALKYPEFIYEESEKDRAHLSEQSADHRVVDDVTGKESDRIINESRSDSRNYICDQFSLSGLKTHYPNLLAFLISSSEMVFCMERPSSISTSPILPSLSTISLL